MHKAVFWMLFVGLCFGTASADAAYVIKLKNGNEYITNRYWYEGSHLLFDTYDGVFGIEKNFVMGIEKRDQIVRPVTVSNRDPSDKPQSDPTNHNQEIPHNTANEETTVKNSKDVTDPIVEEFNRLKQQAQQVDGMLTSEIGDLLSQITAFKNKLSKDSKLFVAYGREFNEAQELASSVETALTARGQ